MLTESKQPRRINFFDLPTQLLDVFHIYKLFLVFSKCLNVIFCIGKTYTMQGLPGNEGIIPRSIDVIFNSIGEHIATVRVN